MPNHYAGDLVHTMAISGLSRLRTELFKLTVVQSLTPHPVQMNRQLSGHRDLRGLPSSAHGQVEELAAPMRLTAHRETTRHPGYCLGYMIWWSDAQSRMALGPG